MIEWNNTWLDASKVACVSYRENEIHQIVVFFLGDLNNPLKWQGDRDLAEELTSKVKQAKWESFWSRGI